MVETYDTAYNGIWIVSEDDKYWINDSRGGESNSFETYPTESDIDNYRDNLDY